MTPRSTWFVLFALLFASISLSFAAAAPAKQDGGTRQEADRLFDEAERLYGKRHFDEAIERLERALPIYRRLGERAAVLQSYYAIGLAQRGRGSRGAAGDAFDEALALSRTLGDTKAESQVRYQIGSLYADYGLFANARDQYERTLTLVESLGLGASRVQVMRALAVVLANDSRTFADQEIEDPNTDWTRVQAENDERAALAETYFDRALALAHELQLPGEEAMTYLERADSRVSVFDLRTAAAEVNTALSIAQRINDPLLQGQALSLRGDIERLVGNPEQALVSLQQAYTLLTRGDDGAAIIKTLWRIGHVYGQRNQPIDQLDFLRQAREIAHERVFRGEEAESLLRAGYVYAALNQYDRAVESYDAAEAIWRDLNHSAARGQTLALKGQVLRDAGRSAEAVRVLDDAKVLHDSLRGDGQVMIARGESLIELDRVGEAQGEFQQALILGNQIQDDDLIARAMNGVGLILVNQGLVQEAKTLFESIIKDREVSPATRRRVLLNLARTAESLGRTEEALKTYLQVITLDEQLRASARIEDFRSKVSDQAASIYQQAILLSLDLGKTEQAFELAEQSRARSFLDQVGSGNVDLYSGADPQLLVRERVLRDRMDALEYAARLERAKATQVYDRDLATTLEAELATVQRDYQTLLLDLKISNPEYTSLRTVSPITFASLRDNIAADTTLVSYFVTPNETVIFVVNKSGIVITKRVAVKEEELRNSIRSFRRSSDRESVPVPSLARLTDWLITPIAGQLTTSKLAIVPHSVLHYVPFAALGDVGTPLGIRYLIFTLPSASVQAFVAQKVKRSTGETMVMAYSEAQPGFAPLRFADKEAQDVAKLYHVEPLTGAAATPSTLLKHAASARIVHIAAHAEFNSSQPLFSRLLLADSSQGSGSLEVVKLYNQHFPVVDLVVLSACETQLADESRGDDLISLSRAFMYAGTPSVIASLWYVDDQATSLLMTTFHIYLQRGAGKAQALQAAQAYVRSLPHYAHPWYWAAFTLTGDPGEENPAVVVSRAELPMPSTKTTMAPTPSMIDPQIPTTSAKPLIAVLLTAGAVLVMIIVVLSRRVSKS